jgi:gamma-glutamyltranspeptidase/glutathione hydrolase
MFARLYLCFLIATAEVITSTSAAYGQGVFATQFVESRAGVVTSDTPLASDIGAKILDEGGNAVDSAIAVAFALAVTWPEAGNIGGGGFMLVAPPKGEVECIEYREKAPHKATANLFVNQQDAWPLVTVGVPGTVAGLKLAHQRYGSMDWRRLIEPAIELAERGFTVDVWLAGSINEAIDLPSMSVYDEIKRVYAPPNGRQWKAGDTLRLPDLADTLRAIANSDGQTFYSGPIAQSIADAMRQFGGLIDTQDMADYDAVVRQPVKGNYKGCEIYGAPLPSSGGISTMLALNMLENLELGDRDDRLSARNIHLMTEVLRRTFWQRAEYLGDSDFVSIPTKLTSKQFAKELALQIDPTHATASSSLTVAKVPVGEGTDTTHFSVIDASGLCVSNTYTLESQFGCNVVVPGTGIILNDEMNDFNRAPGVTNDQGQIGTAANIIQPGKRMLSSQSPTIVKKDGKVVLVTGSPGGRSIISTVVGILVNRLQYDLSPQECIGAARIHHQWYPDKLFIEEFDSPEFTSLLSELEKMGHECVWDDYRQGTANSIFIDSSNQRTGVADLRRGAKASASKAP